MRHLTSVILSISLAVGMSAQRALSIPYWVAEGDNLEAISRKFDVSLTAILQANPTIKDPNLIYAGERIVVPNPQYLHPEQVSPDYYKIAPGDRLGVIAQHHGMSVQALMAANPRIADPNLIFAGEILVIPYADLPKGHRIVKLKDGRVKTFTAVDSAVQRNAQTTRSTEGRGESPAVEARGEVVDREKSFFADKSVIVYGRDRCPRTVQVKEYLDGEGVAYEYRNVDTSSQARIESRTYPNELLPALVVGGRYVDLEGTPEDNTKALRKVIEQCR